jgi:hypothetical protein
MTTSQAPTNWRANYYPKSVIQIRDRSTGSKVSMGEDGRTNVIPAQNRAWSRCLATKCPAEAEQDGNLKVAICPINSAILQR